MTLTYLKSRLTAGFPNDGSYSTLYDVEEGAITYDWVYLGQMYARRAPGGDYIVLRLYHPESGSDMFDFNLSTGLFLSGPVPNGEVVRPVTLKEVRAE